MVVSRVLIVIAVVMLVVGGITAWQQWQDNKKAESTAAEQQARANHGHASGDNPSTNKPSQDEFKNYRVAADEPRYIFIPKINVRAMVGQVGLTKRNAIDAPNNIYNAAWYTGSAKPGQPGAMLIDGHLGFWTTPGIFSELKDLQGGDNIMVERGDGKTFTYKVIKSQTYPVDKVDMKAALAPITFGKPGLNLITCAGNVIKGANTYNQRIVIFSEQQ